VLEIMWAPLGVTIVEPAFVPIMLDVAICCYPTLDELLFLNTIPLLLAAI
jgi:hypothetical protein